MKFRRYTFFPLCFLRAKSQTSNRIHADGSPRNNIRSFWPNFRYACAGAAVAGSTENFKCVSSVQAAVPLRAALEPEVARRPVARVAERVGRRGAILAVKRLSV